MSETDYPNKASLGDLAHVVVKTATQALLGLGVPAEAAQALAESAAMFLPSPLQERQARFLTDLADGVETLRQRVDSLPFTSTDGFAAFATATLRDASETAEDERLEYFRNALLNVAQGGVRRLDLLRSLLGALTVDHVRVLAFFREAHDGKQLRPAQLAHNAAELICASVPGFAGRQDYAELIFRDLWSRSLLAFPLELKSSLGPGEEKVYILNGPRLSSFGTDFCRMISDPNSEEAE